MSNPNDSSIPRRELLRGAAGVLGASLIGLSPAASLAGSGSKAPIQKAFSLGYWDGVSLVSADTMPSGDPTLSNVMVTLHGFGDGSSIQSVDAMMPAEGISPVPFSAWTAPPSGQPCATFLMPLDAKGGLTLNSRLSDASQATIRLTQGKDSGPKLREGTYVLAAGSLDWTGFTYDVNDTGSPLHVHSRGRLPQYIVIQIARA